MDEFAAEVWLDSAFDDNNKRYIKHFLLIAF